MRLKKKKVAHIITRLTLGGAQENTVFTFMNHNREKYDAYLIFGGDESYGGSIYKNNLNNNKNLILIKEMANSINPIKDLKAFIKIYGFLKKNRMDIVHTHSSKAGVIGRIAAKAAGVPAIVHTVHGWSFNKSMNIAKRQIYIWIERIAARFCDRLITVANKDIDKGLAAGIGYRNKYLTIRSGIDFSEFKNMDKEKAGRIRAGFGNKKIIGTIGRISKQKNLFDFVRIAKIFVSCREDVHFVIIGDGPQRKQLEEYSRSLGLCGHITFMGVRQDIIDLYGVIDVLLMTSLWEGLPRVIPEAMFCGVPVVANSVDGVPEIVKDGMNGFTTKPNDLEDVCRKLEKLLDDINLREAIIKNAYDTAYPEYGAHNMVRQIESLYDGIII